MEMWTLDLGWIHRTTGLAGAPVFLGSTEAFIDGLFPGGSCGRRGGLRGAEPSVGRASWQEGVGGNASSGGGRTASSMAFEETPEKEAPGGRNRGFRRTKPVGGESGSDRRDGSDRALDLRPAFDCGSWHQETDQFFPNLAGSGPTWTWSGEHGEMIHANV